MTVNGTFRMTTVLPSGDPSGNKLSTTVWPRTQTFAVDATSASVKNDPEAMRQSRIYVKVGATPTICVDQLLLPAMTCARMNTPGDADATCGSFAIAKPSSGVSVEAPPVPVLT